MAPQPPRVVTSSHFPADRKPLAALLAILGPFLVYGIACSFDASGTLPNPVPPDEGRANAYLCECTCEAPVGNSPEAAATDDDANEDGSGSVDLTDDRLRFSSGRFVGVRFSNVQVPAGSEVVSASIQFTARSGDSGVSMNQIRGEAVADSLPFMVANADVSGRLPTAASVAWNPPDWVGGDAGLAQRTPDLKDVLQEIVDGGGWAAGNAVTFVIATSAGQRRGVSFDDDPARAARLEIVYREPGVGVDVDLSVCMPPDLNPNVDPDVGTEPSDGALMTDCASRVEANLSAMAGMCGYSSVCTCSSPDPARFVDISCNEACVEDPLAPDCANFDPEGGNKTATNAPGMDPVCLVASADPPLPIPDALGGGVFGRNSLCVAEGSSLIEVPDLPNRVPATSAEIFISGDPCPGSFCDVGIAYRAEVDSFSYDGGFLGSGDTTISEIKISGASVPAGVSLIPGGFGLLGAEETLSTGRGRRRTNRVIRSDIDKRQSFTGTNNSQLNVTVDWAGKFCSMDGDLFGGMVIDDDPDMDEEPTESGMTVTTAVIGTLVNQPPQAAAGDDADVECTSPGGATVLLDGSGSSDPDDNITFMRWLLGDRSGPSVGFAAQAQVFQGLDVSEQYVLRVIDAFGQASEDATAVLVEDTTGPTLVPPADVTAECTGHEGTPVVLGVPFAEDVCDTLVDVVNDAPLLFPLGATVVTWTATDDSGNETHMEQTVLIEDTTPPEISLSIDPTMLWPPNHKLHTISAAVEASDICDPSPAIQLVSVLSSEPDDDQTGDGNTSDDVQGADLGADDREFEVRSERKGNGGGRVYTVTYQAVDGSGNATPAMDTVSVARNQRP